MRIVGKTVKKQNLPKKQCPVCHRSFSWHKKWKVCWEAAIYCSKRCQKSQ
ncbi:MAG: DUF2256 domain-containing protein [Opitutales bacterium]|nr:DUF2256 domain-containing protein [Opitutales bacterium]MBT5168130.1 DUF2256 domain-containing protein [Opitutales bacterium]MBT5814540.1 DUF2256 domain-containing protein [Opitutales bacterium]